MYHCVCTHMCMYLHVHFCRCVVAHYFVVREQLKELVLSLIWDSGIQLRSPGLLGELLYPLLPLTAVSAQCSPRPVTVPVFFHSGLRVCLSLLITCFFLNSNLLALLNPRVKKETFYSSNITGLCGFPTHRGQRFTHFLQPLTLVGSSPPVYLRFFNAQAFLPAIDYHLRSWPPNTLDSFILAPKDLQHRGGRVRCSELHTSAMKLVSSPKLSFNVLSILLKKGSSYSNRRA